MCSLGKKLTKSLEEAIEWTKGDRKLRVTEVEKKPDGTIKRKTKTTTNKKNQLYAKDNSKRIKKELRKLKKKNRPLYDLIIDLQEYIEKEFGKDVVLTMIFRTQEEQDYLYRNSKKYDKKPFTSPHQFWQALDIRSWLYTKKQREKICKYLNDKYNKSNYHKWTAKVHEVGKNGLHFHIQYYKA